MDPLRGKWRIGEILVQQGWITWQQLESALEMQEKGKKSEASILMEHGLVSKNLGQSLCLGEILVKNGWLEWKHLEQGLSAQRQSGRILGEILIENKFITREHLVRALAQQLNKSFVKLDALTIPSDVIREVPKHFVVEHQIMPLLKQNGVFLIAISNPQDIAAEAELRKKIPDCEIRSVIAEPADIQKAIARYYP